LSRGLRRLGPRSARAALVALAAIAMTACGGGSGPGADRGRGPVAAGSTYANPVFNADFPDPALLHQGSTWYAYSTQHGQQNIPTLTSTDLVRWTPGGDALPDVGAWASLGKTWAPEVIAIGGRFAMFYVAQDTSSGKQCIGSAWADRPAGPFADRAKRPLVCQTGLGGSIDPDPVRDANGHLYLYWKNDGNCCGRSVHLWGQQLSGDGTRLVGRAVALMTNDKPWQGQLVEAPQMVTHQGRRTLFYSANDYASDRYGIGYASCSGPLGPCLDRSESSLMPSNDVAVGPGHCFVVQLTDGRQWMFFHAWLPNAVGTQVPGRVLFLEPLTWTGDAPSVHPPATTPQPAPTT
jgi:beta-xylosidase